MSKTKTLTILTVAMLVINVVLLTLIFAGGKRNRHRHDGDGHREHGREHFEKKMIRQLGFDQDQASQYQQLHSAQRETYWEITKNIFERKRGINQALAGDDESTARQLLQEVDSLHQLREQHFYDYTKSIFALCNDEQKQKLMETLNRVGEEHRKRRGRRDR